MNWPDKLGIALAIFASAIEVFMVLPMAWHRTHTWFEFAYNMCRGELMLLLVIAIPAWLLAPAIDRWFGAPARQPASIS